MCLVDEGPEPTWTTLQLYLWFPHGVLLLVFLNYITISFLVFKCIKSSSSKRSLRNLQSADSVLWTVLKWDQEVSRILWESMKNCNCKNTVFAKTFSHKRQFWNQSKVREDRGIHVCFFNQWMNHRCLKQVGTTPEVSLLLMIDRTFGPIVSQSTLVGQDAGLIWVTIFFNWGRDTGSNW